VAALALAAAVEGARYRLALLMRPLLALPGCERVLDNRARYLVHGLIIDRPGISYSAIRRELGLRLGAAASHLDILEREHYVRSVRDGRLMRFYTTDTTPPRDQRRVLEYAREALLAIVATLGAVTVWTDTAVERGSTYYYTVAAINAVGQGEAFAAYEVKVPKEQKEEPGFGAIGMGIALAAAVLVMATQRRRCRNR